MSAVTTLGNTASVTIVVCVVAVILAIRGQRRRSQTLVIAMVSGWLVMQAIKMVVRRPRPPREWALRYEPTFSFPSGHAMMSATAATVLIVLCVPLLIHRWQRVLLAVVAAAASLAIGISRVYLAVHWSTDVLVGWVLGVIWALVVITIERRLRLRPPQ